MKDASDQLELLLLLSAATVDAPRQAYQGQGQ
jgi:hypothetical protein